MLVASSAHLGHGGLGGGGLGGGGAGGAIGGGGGGISTAALTKIGVAVTSDGSSNVAIVSPPRLRIPSAAVSGASSSAPSVEGSALIQARYCVGSRRKPIWVPTPGATPQSLTEPLT